MTSVNAVELVSVSKVYRTDRVQTHALNSISLSIQAGEFVTITGPSGCGKSTLLSVLGLLERTTSGHYQLFGRNTAEMTSSGLARVRNETMGFIFQSFHLVPELSAVDNVALVLKFRGVPKAECRARATEVLESVGLQSRIWHYPDQLSGGQQQRVAIARALVGDPRIILADEPTGNLDSKSGEHVLSLMKNLMDGERIIIMVTHDMDVARLGTRRVSMMDGCFVSDEG